jgi:RHS repeat-associated protein
MFGLGGLMRETLLPDGTKFRYEYDAFGRRVLKTGSDLRVRYIWDQNVPLCEHRETSEGKSIIEYLFVPDSFTPLGHAVDGVPFYYELDQRSLIREVYDLTSAVVARFGYRAYGERFTVNLSVPDADSALRMLGQLWDPETGLHYNRFRYYDPVVGRFISPDRFAHLVEHNPYAFSPNPINWVDPFGLMPFPYNDSVSFLEEQAASNGGWYQCANCGFRNKNRVFAVTKETGRPVGDGAFHGGHINAEANGGQNDPYKNGQTEGGTCNCSKGKREKSGMQCIDKYKEVHNTDKTLVLSKKQRRERSKAAKAAMKAAKAAGK